MLLIGIVFEVGNFYFLTTQSSIRILFNRPLRSPFGNKHFDKMTMTTIFHCAKAIASYHSPIMLIEQKNCLQLQQYRLESWLEYFIVTDYFHLSVMLVIGHYWPLGPDSIH